MFMDVLLACWILSNIHIWEGPGSAQLSMCQAVFGQLDTRLYTGAVPGDFHYKFTLLSYIVQSYKIE